MGENVENSQIPRVTVSPPPPTSSSGHYLYHPPATPLCALSVHHVNPFIKANLCMYCKHLCSYCWATSIWNCICDVVSNFRHLIQFFFSLQYLFGTPLMVAARQSDPSVCQVLLDKGADVNLPDSVSLFSTIFEVFYLLCPCLGYWEGEG